MKNKSVKSSLQAFIIAILLLSGFYLLNLYIHFIERSADTRLHLVGGIEKDFNSILLKEKIIVDEPASWSQVAYLYKNIINRIEKIDISLDAGPIRVRRSLLSDLLTLKQDIDNQHDTVQNLMPDMVDSVRYIHEHHIVYLKNLLRRGHIRQDWDMDDNFKRSEAVAAPELKIIRAAVKIQNDLLSVFSIFYKLHSTEPPATIKKDFQTNINRFYDSVNAFEDYSLDAQDGLLVEELLITGRLFEKAFTVLLTNDAQFKSLVKKLNMNGLQILTALNKERARIQSKRAGLERVLITIQYISIFCFLAIIIGLMSYVYKLMQAFNHTRLETFKVQNDIKYHIEVDKNAYFEFRIILEALNAMARTIENQIDSLMKVKGELAIKVKERTAELEDANRKLLKKIKDNLKYETERLELENKLHRARKMEAIGLLAGGVAHDLNNILSGIVSYPDLLLRDLPESSPLKRPLLTIKQTGEKAATIVNDLLTLSRSNVTVTEPVNMNALIETFLDSPEFKKMKSYNGNVAVHTDLSPDLLNIIGSPVHLSKTVMNLIINAFEALPEGGRITISTKNRYIDTIISGYDTVQEGDYVVVSISDNGIGIPDQDLERIFEPFYTKKVMGKSGTGLGMAVVWGTVKDHKGYIDIDSDLKKGTTVTIYLPASRTPLKDHAKAVSLDDYKGRGQKILVIDDIAEQREIASKMLELLGYEVATAPSGEAAVEKIKNGDAYDLLVLDMIMEPGMDGLETYKKVLKFVPGQKAIIASGFSETERVKETQNLGARAYIRKPYTLEVIGITVFNALHAV